MPVVKITMRKGKSDAYKKALLNGVHDALVQAIKVPEFDRLQSLIELDADHFEALPQKSDKVTLIEIILFKGRSIEAKKALYRQIVENLAIDPGIPGEDIMIILHESPLENWGIRGGKAASEVDLGFKIDV